MNNINSEAQMPQFNQLDKNYCPDVYYMEKWGIANAERDGGEYKCYKFESPNGTVLYPYVKRKIDTIVDGTQYYDTLTPYGFNGPIIINSVNKTELLSEFDKAFSAHCRNENIVSEYIRFSPWLKNHMDFKGYYDLRYRTQTLYINLQTDYFNLEFSHARRQAIRKAIKNNVEIKFYFNDEKVNEFIPLYNNMLERQGADSFYEFSESFIKNLFLLMQNNILMANAIYEGKCVSSMILLYDDNYIHCHLGGNDYGYTNMGGNSLIVYAVAEWAKRRNIKVLHLGGALHESLMVYKKGFTKNCILDYYVGTKIRNNEIYNRLVDMCGKNDTGYFPEYR